LRVVFWLANIPILFVGGLVSDEFNSKVCLFLGGWVGGFKVVSAVMGKPFWWLVISGGSLYVVREVVSRLSVYSGGGSFLKMEGDHCS
jgi:hypothetical protein